MLYSFSIIINSLSSNKVLKTEKLHNDMSLQSIQIVRLKKAMSKQTFFVAMQHWSLHIRVIIASNI